MKRYYVDNTLYLVDENRDVFELVPPGDNTNDAIEYKGVQYVPSWAMPGWVEHYGTRASLH